MTNTTGTRTNETSFPRRRESRNLKKLIRLDSRLRGNDGNSYQSGERGYILLPVVLLISLVAAAAYMLNHESALEGDITAGAAEAVQARYVAEAGLQHTLAQITQAGCGPYVDISSESFGNHNYSSTITTNNAGGTITTYPVAVSDDAWIKEDLPTNNYGSDAQLEVYNKWFASNEHRALYRFDIAASGIPAGAMVVSAVVKIFVVTPDPSTSVSVHRVTADWTEGAVTWDNIAGDHDSSSVASIATNPPAGQYVDVNITSLVQGWLSGSIANQGIMLKPSLFNNDDLSEYTSKEYGNSSQWPWLEIKVADGSLANRASVSVTGTLGSGIAHSATLEDIALYQPPSNLIWQASAGLEDAYTWDGVNKNKNFGTSVLLSVDNASEERTTLVRFQKDAIPPDANVVSASVELYLEGGTSLSNAVLDLHALTRSWVEGDMDGATPGTNGGVTYNDYDGTSPWISGGGDFDPLPADSITLPALTPGWYSWDVTAAIQDWLAGAPDYGFLLRASAGMADKIEFTSSDSPTTNQHPRLVLNIACECGQTCVIPQGSGTILLVIGDDTSPAPADLKKQSVFEVWGYTVNLLDDNASQASFDSAMSNNDVAYISETVSEWTLGNKLVTTSKGVVIEEGGQNDDLGLSSSDSRTVGNSIDIVDNSHYITALLPVGVLPVYRRPMEGLLVTGTPAPGLQTLGNLSGTASLALVDTGGALEGGGTAAGRRVAVPVGRSSKFNWDYLNNNGRLIVQRAIQWGTGNTSGAVVLPPGLWLSTLDDVASSGAPGLDAWTDGEALAVSDPNLTFEPGTTNGTFTSVMNLDNFAADGNAEIHGLHLVGSDITVGSDNSVALQTGDVLITSANNETLNSDNSITVNNEDVFVFRPTTADDYSSGTFIFLLDGSQIHGENNTVGISLVEKTTSVGDGTLAQGSFLMAVTNRRDVIEFIATDVGAGTTNGAFNEFIDGPSLSLGSEIRGIDLVEDAVDLGGRTIPGGAILLTMNNDDSGGVGDNLVPVDGADIFYLTVTQVGSDPVADAALLFEGSDVSLDTSIEHLHALTLANPPLSAGVTGPIAHWKLDDAAGTTAVDSVGGHDGTFVGDPTWSTGTLGGALDFDGTGDRVDVGSILDAGAPQITVTA